jgi:RNA polymerase sigma-70 factor (ECF subfamily)
MDDLVRRYQRRVYAVVYRMTGTASDADDLCQETFLQVFRSLPRFKDGTDLDAWVYRIAMNVSIDHLRRKSRDAAAPPGAVERLPAPRPSDPELEAAVRRAVDQLPPDQKAVLVLRMFEGLSHDQIADVLAAPAATVRWRLFAARRRLEELLSPYLQEK